MSDTTERWMWYIDYAPLQTLLRTEAWSPRMQLRAASSPELVHAISLHMEGRKDEALAELGAASTSGNQPGELHAAFGQLLFESGRIAEAAAQFAEQANLEPASETAGYNHAVCLAKLEKWNEAAEAFEHASASAPERLEIWLGLGVSRMHNGEAAQAGKAFAKALELSPDHDMAAYGRAVALHMQGGNDEAGKLYEKCLERNPKSQWILSNLVSLHTSSGDMARAKRYAASLYEIDPKSATAIEGLAAAAFVFDDNAAAERYPTLLTEAFPDRFEAWFNLGVSLQAQRKLTAAAEAYANAIRINGKSELPLINLAIILHEQGKFEESREHYERAFELAPEMTAPLWNFALALERTGKNTQAAVVLEELVSRDPENAAALFRLGQMRFEAGIYQQAADAFQSASRGRATWPEAQYNLALSYWSMGAHDLALIAIDRALSDGPPDAATLKAGVTIALDASDFIRAAEILERLHEQDPDFANLSHRTAAALDAAGDAGGAANVYRRLIHFDPVAVEALVNLGFALSAQGQESEARELWAKAIELRPELALES